LEEYFLSNIIIFYHSMVEFFLLEYCRGKQFSLWPSVPFFHIVKKIFSEIFSFFFTNFLSKYSSPAVTYNHHLLMKKLFFHRLKNILLEFLSWVGSAVSS